MKVTIETEEFSNLYRAACVLAGNLNAEQLVRLRQQVQIELARRNVRVEPAFDDYSTEQTT